MSLAKTRLLLDICEKLFKEEDERKKKKEEEEAIALNSIKKHPFIVFHGPLPIMPEAPTSRDQRIRCVDIIRRGRRREGPRSPRTERTKMG